MADGSIIPALQSAFTEHGWQLKERRVRKLGDDPVGVTLVFGKGPQSLTVTILSRQEGDDEQ